MFSPFFLRLDFDFSWNVKFGPDLGKARRWGREGEKKRRRMRLEVDVFLVPYPLKPKNPSSSYPFFIHEAKAGQILRISIKISVIKCLGYLKDTNFCLGQLFSTV